MYRKNTPGQFIYFALINASTGAALTGAAVTAYRALGNASQASATGSAVELGNGQYRWNLSQADTNADYGSFLFTALLAVPVEKTVVFTSANPQDSDAFGLSRLDVPLSSIKSKTDLITSDKVAVLVDRVNGGTITMQYSESTAVTIPLPENTIAATLQFVVALTNGTDVLTVANGSISRTASSATVTITNAVTGTLGQYLWSIRDVTGGGNRVIVKGVLAVQNAAAVDA